MGHEPQPGMEPEELPQDEGAVSDEDRLVDRVTPPLPTGDLIGRTLEGRYRFEALLGEGTFARVFRVYDLHRRVHLAAKVLRSDIAQEPAFLERFRREATVLARLQHPHIVRYYEIVEADSYVFILTDYISGQTLQKVLRDHGGPLDPFESLTYLTPLAAALHYAHNEDIIHRDLKPANILIDENGNLYVTDFGIARILSDSSTLTVDMTVGTPHYMSPEQILTAKVTTATDIYALGVMLYQMYTGQLPFMGDSEGATGTTSAVRIVYEHLHVQPRPPRDLNPALSEAVQDVILRCLEKDPAQRYSSVSELYEALSEAIGTPSVALDSVELAGVRAAPLAEPEVEPAAERVPTGVGGASRIVPEEEGWFDEPEDKPKRKVKREAWQPPQGEKYEEKERESQEKNEEKQAEKGWDVNVEKGELVVLTGSWGDRLSQFVWGGGVVWVGIVLLVGWPTAYMLSGIGALLLGEVAVRQIMPEYHARPGLRLMVGMILLAAGLGMGFSMGSLWALILIAFGASLLLNHLVE